MAAAHLLAAGESLEALADRVPAASLRTIAQMIERGVQAPLTSSVGRLFDAVSRARAPALGRARRLRGAGGHAARGARRRRALPVTPPRRRARRRRRVRDGHAEAGLDARRASARSSPISAAACPPNGLARRFHLALAGRAVQAACVAGAATDVSSCPAACSPTRC
jgi:hypothetical protein